MSWGLNFIDDVMYSPEVPPHGCSVDARYDFKVTEVGGRLEVMTRETLLVRSRTGSKTVHSVVDH